MSDNKERERLNKAALEFLTELDEASVEQGGDPVFREYIESVEYPEQPLVDFHLRESVKLREKLAAAKELFTTLLEPVGPFSRNPAVHAMNIIDEVIATAQKGIAIIDGKEAK